MAESTEAKSDKYAARLTQAVEHLRGNVKWTLLAFGAIGTTLLAGSQLSNLGKFGYDEPRLWFALGCALLAMAASAYAVASALAVAYSGYTELYGLDEADIAYVQHNKALLEGFASVDALRREYEKATEKRHRHLMNPETDAGELADDKIWYFYLDGLVDKVLSYIRYNRIQQQVDRSRTQLTVASVVAALALIGFAWAANPSAEQPALVLRSPASQAKLSASGKATLTPVLGADCAARATIDVIVLNVTTSGSEVVTLASKDCPVARFTLTSGMGKLASDGNAAGAAAPMPGPTAAAEPIVWTQLRPDRTGAKGQLIARAIVGREQACPRATVDGASRRMEAPADGTDPDFAIKLCETAIPGDAKATIAGIEIKPRPTQPRKIVVIGDTGCRITDYAAQACDRASDWPFFRVAAAAAKLQPDLIIHVDDYHYREKPARAGRPATGARTETTGRPGRPISSHRRGRCSRRHRG